MNIITLYHGSGGKGTHELIDNIFYKYFYNKILDQQGDSSIINNINGRIAITTDSYVIEPIFFPGGDIGKLSVCGTVNDLAVVGAIPLYLTAGFIIEEGFDVNDLEKIAISMANAAKKAGVKIIAGDTKVVEKGKGDKIYINTAGIGSLRNDVNLGIANIEVGDKIIVSGTLGDHGTAILCKRQDLNFETEIESDCNALNGLIEEILNSKLKIRFMRDITRGGLATVLNEITNHREQGILLDQNCIPVREEVSGVCEILGVDPLYIANEGRVLVVVASEHSEKVLDIIRNNPLGKEAAVIGEVVKDKYGRVLLQTNIRGTRILDMAEAEIIPRIC
ncbi:hydrogenase expression/formation protein HypE [Clostridium manihotivorum]|uniref:Hydrogenase expression/formation protein HypE n=1 Tax=Clostridium manihotivorum TaxID=2320868 RepID=A0A3R5TIS1_9CLOT|nr:hydrogenase expression/formation protein HypE [Clostridium manihotivorum]QAA34458.1 hydrogenase expression/formation protein HypE [Clostridium manihotivorum]